MNGRSRQLSVIIGLVTMVVIGVFGIAYALPSFLTNFNTQYGTAGTVLNTCNLCHIPPGQSASNLNPYGSAFGGAGNFTAIEPLDSDSDGFTNIAEINARTFPGDPTSFPAVTDTTPPQVTAFVVPSTSSSLAVPITSLTATDNVAVTGYLVTESATPPLASAAGWTATAPTSHAVAAAGTFTLFGWAKDAAGNVSASLSATVTVAVTDTTPPQVTAFDVPSTSSSLAVPITTFTATDNVAVTGYLVTESATPPLASAAGWTATAPTSHAVAAAGTFTLFAWAKDAAGNVSASLNDTVIVTAVGDTTPPQVTAFDVPSTSSSLSVPITTFTATDNVAVTGYLVTESSTAPLASAAGWTATAPTSHTVAAAGIFTLFGWAKDAAGNVSASRSGTVVVTAISVAVDDDDDNNNCFIATAAFGSYLSPSVRILRGFRDTFLLTNSAGQTFVAWYYHVSPPIATVIARNGSMRAAVRIGLLPAIAFSALSLAIGFTPALVILLLVLVTSWLGIRKIGVKLRAVR